MKREILIFVLFTCFIFNISAQEVFTKYQRGYQIGNIGNIIKNGTFDINIPDNPSIWSDFPSGIGYATLNVFGGDKMVSQLLSNADYY